MAILFATILSVLATLRAVSTWFCRKYCDKANAASELFQKKKSSITAAGNDIFSQVLGISELVSLEKQCSEHTAKYLKWDSFLTKLNALYTKTVALAKSRISYVAGVADSAALVTYKDPVIELLQQTVTELLQIM